MSKYEIFVYWSEHDECFVSEVPELPSIKAHGDNQTEALENAQQAIELWVKVTKEDGIKIPKPKGKLKYAQLDSGFWINKNL